MKEYVIIADMYEARGGSFKYALNPSKSKIKFNYSRSEREGFIEKAEKLIKDDMVYENVKLYFIDYSELKVLDITEKLTELKTSI